MKSKSSPWAVPLILSWILSYGAVHSMVTGFRLALEPRWLPAAVCLGTALLTCLLSCRRSRGWLLAALLAAAAVHLWRRTELPHQLWQLVYRITHHYHAAYGCGVFKLVDTPWDAGTAELPLVLLGAVIAAASAHSLLRGQGSTVPFLLSLLPLVSCLVVTDTVPSPGALFLLLLGQLLMLLSSHVRRRDRYQADRLVLFMAVPVMVFLGLIFSHLPTESYVNHSERIQTQILDWLQELPLAQASEPKEVLIASPQQEPAALDLSALGPRQASADRILSVLSDAGGTLYLRGQDLDQYDGRKWISSPYRVEPLGCQGTDLGILTIETALPMEELYLPYYPQGGLSLIGGQVANGRLSSAYSFRRQGLPELWQSPPAGEADYSDVDPGYLSLPAATLAGAEPLLPPVLRDQETISQQASAIASFVRSRSRYDLQAERMPEEEEDFALWFLEEAPSGYCVHYATATVVLLRAAGIPARYVSGYLVHPEAGIPVTVTEQQAHAWAEYYEPGLKTWVVAEATPAAGVPFVVPPPASPTTAPTVTAPTESTQPPAQTPPAVTETAPAAAPVQKPPEPAASAVLPSWFLYGTGGALLLLIQPELRRGMRRRRLRKASPNRRCLLLWREAETLARLLRTSPPPPLEALALKARFSQHTVTEQELQMLSAYLREGTSLLMKRPWYQRLLYRFVYALHDTDPQ